VRARRGVARGRRASCERGAPSTLCPSPTDMYRRPRAARRGAPRPPRAPLQAPACSPEKVVERAGAASACAPEGYVDVGSGRGQLCALAAPQRGFFCAATPRGSCSAVSDARCPRARRGTVAAQRALAARRRRAKPSLLLRVVPTRRAAPLRVASRGRARRRVALKKLSSAPRVRQLKRSIRCVLQLGALTWAQPTSACQPEPTSTRKGTPLRISFSATSPQPAARKKARRSRNDAQRQKNST
jgi:hypothetical protein